MSLQMDALMGMLQRGRCVTWRLEELNGLSYCKVTHPEGTGSLGWLTFDLSQVHIYQKAFVYSLSRLFS